MRVRPRLCIGRRGRLRAQAARRLRGRRCADALPRGAGRALPTDRRRGPHRAHPLYTRFTTRFGGSLSGVRSRYRFRKRAAASLHKSGIMLKHGQQARAAGDLEHKSGFITRYNVGERRRDATARADPSARGHPHINWTYGMEQYILHRVLYIIAHLLRATGPHRALRGGRARLGADDGDRPRVRPAPSPSLALSLSPRAASSRSLADSLSPPCSLPRTLSLSLARSLSPPLLPLECTASCRRRASRLYSVDHLRAAPNWALVAAAGVLYSEVGFGRIVASETEAPNVFVNPV